MRPPASDVVVAEFDIHGAGILLKVDAAFRTGNRHDEIAFAIRANYGKPLRVEHLAEIAGMGVSTLHHHFRVLTAMSPLQYQKQLRLQAARGHMLLDGLDAASAGFEVGYESVSQFNRKYSRFFGQPPVLSPAIERDYLTPWPAGTAEKRFLERFHVLSKG